MPFEFTMTDPRSLRRLALALALALPMAAAAPVGAQAPEGGAADPSPYDVDYGAMDDDAPPEAGWGQPTPAPAPAPAPAPPPPSQGSVGPALTAPTPSVSVTPSDDDGERTPGGFMAGVFGALLPVGGAISKVDYSFGSDRYGDVLLPAVGTGFYLGGGGRRVGAGGTLRTTYQFGAKNFFLDTGPFLRLQWPGESNDGFLTLRAGFSMLRYQVEDGLGSYRTSDLGYHVELGGGGVFGTGRVRPMLSVGMIMRQFPGAYFFDPLDSGMLTILQAAIEVGVAFDG